MRAQGVISGAAIERVRSFLNRSICDMKKVNDLDFLAIDIHQKGGAIFAKITSIR